MRDYNAASFGLQCYLSVIKYWHVTRGMRYMQTFWEAIHSCNNNIELYKITLKEYLLLLFVGAFCSYMQKYMYILLWNKVMYFQEIGILNG